MMTKFFVDSDGSYVGGFDGEGAVATVPDGAIEVPSAPDDQRQMWNFAGGVWLPAPPLPPLPARERATSHNIFDALKAKGVLSDADIP